MRSAVMQDRRWLPIGLVLLASCGGSGFHSAIADGGLDAAADAARSAEAGDSGASDSRAPDSSRADAARLDGGEGGGGGGDATVEDGPGTDGACALVTYYLDGDNDGYGGTTTMKSCVPPTTMGPWVTEGGDCDDSNNTVNPGQSSYFSSGYVPTGQTDVSFDYNCDGHETESGNSSKANCQFSGLSCGGSGYLQATPLRMGAEVDPFCGSDRSVACSLMGISCAAGAATTVSPITCH